MKAANKLNAQSKAPSGMEFPVEEAAGLLAFLLLKLRHKSRNNVKSLLTRKAVTVNGKTVTHYDHALHPGQIVRIISPAQLQYKKPKRLKIIFEDEELIAVNKPAGLLTVASDTEKLQTMYHDVTGYVQREDPAKRIFVVHRLDKDTSGVVLFAKTEQIKHALQDNWNALVKRRGYIALVEGRLPDKTGTIRSWLKETKTHHVYSSHTTGDGVEAVTSYQVLRESKAYSLLDINLETGRKNQIRVHMTDIEHPIAGDKKYGAQTNPFKRLALHAGALELTHPVTGQPMVFSSTTPANFLSVFENK